MFWWRIGDSNSNPGNNQDQQKCGKNTAEVPQTDVSGRSSKQENSTSNALDMHSSGAFESENIVHSLQILESGLDDDGLRAAVDAWNGPEHLKVAMRSLIDAGQAH
ncbi:MAG: hypothetical protein QF473_36925 [Planctomycetota bacterium]|jgi:hypothetical protein|nr:hypothetical protein [Planctomycetota bacterium]MDP6503515.1 hypothetical protein [Planctomycetota bacterium]